MNVEIVWLAYDAQLVQRAWSDVSVRQLYTEVLQDNFRRRVDPRSMLFHKSQYYLLNDLELLMKCGASDLSLQEYLARLFHKGVEEFPTDSGELFFDYRIISYYTSLRMADEHHLVEPFFKTLLSQQSKLAKDEPWGLLQVQDIRGFFRALSDIKIQDVIDAAKKAGQTEEEAKAFIKLVTNYIEFYHYTRNNDLELFYYNNQTDIRRWGNLSKRKQQRDKLVVELTYSKTTHGSEATKTPSIVLDDDLISKMRFKRRIENLEAGLQDQDPLIRQKAAEGLGVAGNYGSVLPLIKALTDEEPEVRQEVLRALAAIRDPRSVEAIIQLILKDDSIGVIMSGAHALVQIGDPRGLEALIELLLRGVYDVAVQIANFPNLIKNKTAVNMLLQAMDHPNEVVRRQVAFVLGDIPNKLVVDRLLRSLDDEDAEVKTNSASSLGRIGSKRALPELYQCRNSLTPPQTKWVVEEAIDSILEKGRVATG